MDKIKGLICRECSREYPAEDLHVCEFCFGPLEVNYNYDEIKQSISHQSLRDGPPSMWRYKDLLPVTDKQIVGENSGFTPLIKAENLGRELGLNNLYLKNDSVNHPTLSFKDRVVSVALSRAKEMGFDTVACASTGNLGNSVAALAAEAGFRCFIFIPRDLELGKVVGSQIYEPTLISVDGSYDDVNRLCSEIANETPWAFVNINIRPYYSEGSKTLAYETAEQMEWTAPDQVVVPIGSGSLLTKIYKGFQELQMLGLIPEAKVKTNGAQAEGCSPVATAFKEGRDFIKPVRPETIAKSIAIGNPADGYYAIRVATETGGAIESVTDDELVEGMLMLGRTEGIFTETAGGVTVAVLKKLVEQGKIAPDDRTVVYITGNGLKTHEAIMGAVKSPIKIKPQFSDFKDQVKI